MTEIRSYDPRNPLGEEYPHYTELEVVGKAVAVLKIDFPDPTAGSSIPGYTSGRRLCSLKSPLPREFALALAEANLQVFEPRENLKVFSIVDRNEPRQYWNVSTDDQFDRGLMDLSLRLLPFDDGIKIFRQADGNFLSPCSEKSHWRMFRAVVNYLEIQETSVSAEQLAVLRRLAEPRHDWIITWDELGLSGTKRFSACANEFLGEKSVREKLADIGVYFPWPCKAYPARPVPELYLPSQTVEMLRAKWLECEQAFKASI